MKRGVKNVIFKPVVIINNIFKGVGQGLAFISLILHHHHHHHNPQQHQGNITKLETVHLLIQAGHAYKIETEATSIHHHPLRC